MTRNWKTSLTGIMAIIFGGWGIAQPIISGKPAGADETTNAMAAIIAGIGLLAAKDYNVTGVPPTK